MSVPTNHILKVIGILCLLLIAFASPRVLAQAPQAWNLNCSGGLCTYSLMVPAGNVTAINNVLVKVSWAQNQSSSLSLQVGSLRMQVDKDSSNYNKTIQILKALQQSLFDHLTRTNATLQQAKAKLQVLKANVTQTNNTIYQFAESFPCYASCLNQGSTTASPSPTSPAPLQCQHNGTSTNGYCICKIGWYGRTCSEIVCLNGAIPSPDKSHCTCQAGIHWGTHCGMNGTVWTTTPEPTTPHPCVPNPCNNGTCTPHEFGDFACTCPGNLDPEKNCTEVAAATCPVNGTLIVPGPLLSPSFPGQYGTNFDCIWTLTAPHGSHVWFQVLQMKLESGNEVVCPTNGCCDYLIVYDGVTRSNKLQGPLCGTGGAQSYVSSYSGNAIMVEFKSDPSLMMYETRRTYHEQVFAAETMCTEDDPCFFRAEFGFSNSSCDQKTCLNGGYCVNKTCICPNKYKQGPVCGTNVEPCSLAPCLHNGTCTNGNETAYTCNCKSPYYGKNCGLAPVSDCEDVHNFLTTAPGVHNITVNGRKIQVYCSEGYTYIQRRTDGTDFNKNWDQYTSGFGDLMKSFWLGLENIYDLTNNNGKSYTITVDLHACSREKEYTAYSTFKVGSASQNYNLTVAGGSGPAKNAMNFQNQYFNQDQQPFSTPDRSHSNTNCAQKFESGWWFPVSYCDSITANLNGIWHSDCSNTNPNNGIQWDTWKNYQYSYIYAAMKLKSN